MVDILFADAIAGGRAMGMVLYGWCDIMVMVMGVKSQNRAKCSCSLQCNDRETRDDKTDSDCE
jgi:hypothetical protein